MAKRPAFEAGDEGSSPSSRTRFEDLRFEICD